MPKKGSKKPAFLKKAKSKTANSTPVRAHNSLHNKMTGGRAGYKQYKNTLASRKKKK